MTSPQATAGPSTAPAPGNRNALPAHDRSRRNYRFFSAAIFVVALISVPVYFIATHRMRLAASSGLGRAYGALGAVLFLILIAYPLRKLVYRARAVPLESWYRVHLALGVLCLAVVGCHAGVAFRSWFLIALELSFWGAVLTGLAGWTGQWWLLTRMRQRGYPAANLVELEPRRKKLLNLLMPTGEEVAPPGPEIALALEKLRHDRTQCLWKIPSWNHWQRESRTVISSEEFSELESMTKSHITELNEIEVLCCYHRLLRFWPTWHLLFGIFAIQMVAWHIWMVIYFPR